jgi:cell division protein FtsB
MIVGMKSSELEDRLEQEIAALKREVAEKEEKIQKLERQLAEHRNSRGFSGGESFLDTCSTPQLLRIDNAGMKSSELEDQLEQENAALKGELAAKEEKIQKLERQLDLAEHRNPQGFSGGESFLDTCATPHLLRMNNTAMKISELEGQLEQENATLKRELTAKEEDIQKLEKQLDLAEHRNSHDFSGGESFLDTCATPHLLNKAVERVYSISSGFTKLLMHALQHHGRVDCPNAAQALAKSVTFERVAHTKFVYQALACKVLFTDFENEYFNVDENAPENVLDPEQLTKENFQRYTELIALENPEELVFEDATDNDFRRLCSKKHQDLVVALSKTLAPGVANVGALLFGNVYGPKGICRSSWTSAETQYQIKIASTFVKFVLSVFLVHKLALALRPIARIFRVREGAEFSSTHMEAVVALADCEDDDVTLVPLSAALTIVPGFQVNRIIVHSRVYTVKRL